MIKRLILTLALLALLFGGIFAWKAWQSGMQAGAQAPPPPVVSTQKVRAESWQPALSAVGTILPTRGVIVSAEVPGIVRQIHFDSGQPIDTDELLVELDAQVDKAELAALQAEGKLAEVTRDRQARIVSDNLGSRSDLDEAEANLDSARARVAAEQATINKKSIRAPFAGELGIRRINPGQYLAPGDEIVQLVALDPIFAEYTLPERFLNQIATDQTVNVRVRAWPDTVFTGRIRAISPSVEQETRSVKIRALFDNPDRRLRPGMFAEVDTLLPQQNGVMTLPERAVTYNPFGDSVFVIVGSGDQATVRRVQVTTGAVRDGRIEITGGLESDAEVVTDGHNKLRNGQPVEIDNSIDADKAANAQ